jgi:hypothetical protein
MRPDARLGQGPDRPKVLKGPKVVQAQHNLKWRHATRGFDVAAKHAVEATADAPFTRREVD